MGSELGRDQRHGLGEDQPHGLSEDQPHGLSEQQRRVLDLLAVGMDTPEIAALLHLSRAAVKRHLRRLAVHYGVDDRTSLVAAAYRAGESPGLARLAEAVGIEAGQIGTDARDASAPARSRTPAPRPAPPAPSRTASRSRPR